MAETVPHQPSPSTSPWYRSTSGTTTIPKPVLAGDTRWNREIDMVERFLANRCYYQQIIQEQEKDFSFDSLIVAKVMDYSLCKDGKELVDQLRPIASALDRCPTNGSLLMQMYAMPGWASCTPPPRESCQQAIPRCRHARAPHMLHPKYRGEKLTMEQQQDVSTWLASRDPGFITSFTSFQAKAAPFPRSYFSAEAISISPHTWWQGAAVCGVDPAFADLIQRLTSPTSSASIERVFSTFSFIHNKIRSKLVFCCHRLHGTKDLGW